MSPLISGATMAAAMAALTHPPKLRREIVLRGLEKPVVAWRLA